MASVFALACGSSGSGDAGAGKQSDAAGGAGGLAGGSGSGGSAGSGVAGDSGSGGTAGSGGGDAAGAEGGTWVVTPSGAAGKPGPGGGTRDAGTSVVTCTPGVVGAFVTGCGYPYASSIPLTNVDFNESEVLRAIRASVDANGGTVSLFYNDEHALTMGVRQVVVKSAQGSTSTDFPVSPLTTNPGSVLNPQTGTNDLVGNNSGLDPSLRPLWPVLYITDVTNDPNSRAGDWQMGGRPINPNAIYGSWKSAVRTVDLTTNTVSVTPDPDPAKNNLNLGINDAVPSGIKDEGWSAEVKWKVSFQPGHSYRLQVIVHDGDQNKAGGDCGQACVVFCAGGSTPPPTLCADSSLICGPGLGENGTNRGCAPGSSCLNGCCVPLTCPSGAAACGDLGPDAQSVGCGSGLTCVSGCCVDSSLIIL